MSVNKFHYSDICMSKQEKLLSVALCECTVQVGVQLGVKVRQQAGFSHV